MRNVETNIQNKIMLEMSARGAMVWRNQTGKFRSMNDPNRIISVGQTGSADILACVPTVITLEMVGKTVGLCVAIEVKTETGKQRSDQKSWQEAFENHGGRYILARGVNDLSI
jgi:hypothetical protein